MARSYKSTSDRTVPREARRLFVPTWLGLSLLLLLAFLLRWFYARAIYFSNFDSSTVGLMALDILDGQRPLFFYGQNYMGALEAYLAALCMGLFGPSQMALSLSPILFSLAWIAATWGLVRELYSRRVAWAAAACLALPGPVVSWYSVGSYGGYPAFLFLGTLTLWLAVRLEKHLATPRQVYLLVGGIGFCAGLALWTNFQSAVFLLVALPYLLRFTRSRRVAELIGPVLSGLALFAFASSPVWLNFGAATGSHTLAWSLAGERIATGFSALSQHCLPPLFRGSAPTSSIFLGLIILQWVGGVALFFMGRLGESRFFRRMDYYLPLWAAAAFLLLFVPHELAAEGAARYAITLWTFMLLLAFAIPMATHSPGLRRVAWALLLLHLACNAGLLLHTVHRAAPKKQESIARRSAVVEHARAIGNDTVRLVGGFIFGHYGQQFTFACTNQIRFVSCYDERIQEVAQRAETATPYTLACRTSEYPRIKRSLDMLGVRSQRNPADPVSFFWELQVPRTRGRVIHPAGVQLLSPEGISGEAASLLDRRYDSGVQGRPAPDAGFLLDLGAEYALDRIWLTSAHSYMSDLPTGFRIEVSLDGQQWETINGMPDCLPTVYTEENQVYAKGFLPRMECALFAHRARYLRFVCCGTRVGKDGQPSPWRINEVVLFESLGAGSPVADEEIRELQQRLEQAACHFAVAPRWLSARLLQEQAAGRGKVGAFPRFNSKFHVTCRDRVFRPRSDWAIVVPRALAEDTRRLLDRIYDHSAIRAAFETEHYQIFLLDDVDPESEPLLWNGHFLLQPGPEAPRLK